MFFLVDMPMCLHVQNLYIPQQACLRSPPDVVFQPQVHSDTCGCMWISGHQPVAGLNSLT